jgi:hypothetical protein
MHNQIDVAVHKVLKSAQIQNIAEREFVVDKLHVKVKSIFVGEKSIADKLFTIANRKLKGFCNDGLIAIIIFMLIVIIILISIY